MILRWKPFKKSKKTGQPDIPSSGSLTSDLAAIKELLGDSPLFVFRQYSDGLHLVYSREIVDHNIINRDIMASLPLVESGEITPLQVSVGYISATTDLKTAACEVLKG